MKILASIIINTIALLVTAYFVPGFTIVSWQTAVLAAIVYGIINAFIKPLLVILTLPITILTLGLFIFIINAIVLFLTSAVVHGLTIDGWIPGIIGAIVLSLVSAMLSSLLGDSQS